MLAWDEIQKRRRASAEKLTAAGLQTSEGFLAALGDIDKRLQQQAAEKLAAEDRARKEEDRQRAITRQTEADKAEAERAKNVEARAAAAEARAVASADVASREKARQEAAPIVDVMRRQGKTASEIGAVLGQEDRFKRFAGLNDLDVEGIMREQAAIDEALSQKRSDEAARAARDEARFRAQQDAERQQRGLAFRQQKFREAESARDAALREADKRNQLYLEQQKMAGEPSKRPLSADAIQQLDRAAAGIEAIKKVRESAAGMTGRASSKWHKAMSFVGMDPEWDVFRSNVDQMVQLVGVFLEGGKLAEGDANRYRRMLGDENLSPESFSKITSDIEATVRSNAARQSAALSRNYDVPPEYSPTSFSPANKADAGVKQDDEEALIDTMIRAGKSEQEIESAVEALRLTRGR